MQDFSEQPRKNGRPEANLPLGSSFVNKFAGLYNLPPEIVPMSLKHAERYSSSPYLYSGANNLIENILNEPESSKNRVIIWSKRQSRSALWNIHKSGILHARRTIKDKGRYTVRVVDQKETALPDLALSFYEKGIRKIVIVDDHKERLLALSKIKQSIPEDMDIVFVWINRGENSNNKSSEESNIIEIKDLYQLRKIKQQKWQNEDVGWLIDWDNTLINSKKQAKEIEKDLALRLNLLIGKGLIPPDISFALDPLFVASMIDVQTIAPGMSGSEVKRIKSHKGWEMALKYNVREPHKIKNEIVRHNLLEKHGYQGVISSMVASSDKGVGAFVAFPFNMGKSLEQRFLAGEISDQEAMRLMGFLINHKVMLWSRQEKQEFDPKTFVSMHREIWNSTLEQLPTGLVEIAKQFNLDTEDLIKMPISFSGQIGRSLGSCIEDISKFINTKPPYTIVSHNDVSAGNTFVELDPVSFTFLDYEWAGPSDPAEALTRVVKQMTTSYMKKIDDAQIVRNKDHLDVKIQGEWPSSVIAAQEAGMAALEFFPKFFDDPKFLQRFNMYMACIYIRELAFASSRLKDLRAALFPLAMTSYYVNQAMGEKAAETHHLGERKKPISEVIY